jgi:dephospho-CoA kinase
LRELGARVIDADQLAREVVAPGTPGFDAVAARWPEVISNGTIDRAALAAIVFANPAERDALNAIVHPRVRARAAQIERSLGDGVAVHVVPLLFEGDYWKECDATILVVAPLDTRIQRVSARDGMARDQIMQRIGAQIDPETARSRATYVIENDSDLTELAKRTEAVWQSLLEQGSRGPAQSDR